MLKFFYKGQEIILGKAYYHNDGQDVGYSCWEFTDSIQTPGSIGITQWIYDRYGEQKSIVSLREGMTVGFEVVNQ